MKKKHFVFCYGTLRKNESNHHLLKDANCICEHSLTEGKMFDTGYGYPVIIQDAISKVHGELYEITDEELDMLDRLEGYESRSAQHNLYERIRQKVITHKGEYEAFVYIEGVNQNLCTTYIEHGDWKVYRKNREDD
ncbi:gamma-glutamylcyclotransferase family protein [Evansella cellulosilytica]|uniref:Gamma-glutamylcyclotransferase family protein n=1 Tax=Evansella cellulosilytica (strain ATCC 21833 / DSM 2522 / FERM P-1141 / JCM 9156 / N-4) TaxID=649639 RepID=E6TXI5_EVAC2|nr:gamma-glutamylcyclotransferase family protein [Evansella cellulosilytica]ADU28799.1 AIG2 family protein [Evansella cellulosilytica DSM 2522]